MKEQPPAPHPHVDVEKVYGRPGLHAQPTPSAQPAAPVTAVPQNPAQPVADDGKRQFRKYFLYVLIGGVIISALISVVAILIGEVNDYISRALLTTLSMVIHAMIALAFMSATNHTHSRGQELVINTLFGITIASFFTSTLSIWKVIDGQTTTDFYQLYFYALIAAFIIQAMLSVNVIDKITANLMRAAQWMTVGMWVYLIPSVFDNSYPKSWPEIYYRGIAALGILLGTTLILVVIFHRLYVTKHPELKVPGTPKAGGMPVWLIVLLCVVGGPMVLGYLSAIIGVLGYAFGAR